MRLAATGLDFLSLRRPSVGTSTAAAAGLAVGQNSYNAGTLSNRRQRIYRNGSFGSCNAN